MRVIWHSCITAGNPYTLENLPKKRPRWEKYDKNSCPSENWIELSILLRKSSLMNIWAIYNRIRNNQSYESSYFLSRLAFNCFILSPVAGNNLIGSIDLKLLTIALSLWTSSMFCMYAIFTCIRATCFVVTRTKSLSWFHTLITTRSPIRPRGVGLPYVWKRENQIKWNTRAQN